METTIQFKVIAISDNTNSFGLHSFVCLSKDGTTFRGCKYKETSGLGVGSIVNVPLKSDLFADYSAAGFEIPESLPKAPIELINEIWGK